jgi:hypothetical protein
MFLLSTTQCESYIRMDNIFSHEYNNNSTIMIEWVIPETIHASPMPQIGSGLPYPLQMS